MTQSQEPGVYYLDVSSGGVRRDWCDRCMTSAALTAEVYARAGSGPCPIGRFWTCARCGPDELGEG